MTIERSRSALVLPSIGYDRYGDFYYKGSSAAPHAYQVRRSGSVPDLTAPTSWRYSPNPYRRLYLDAGPDDAVSRNWELGQYYSKPLYYPRVSWPNRRCHALDPPYSLWWNCPSLSLYSRYGRYADYEYLEPLRWRRWRDPYYDRPLWYPFRPWYYESINNQRAADMCRRKVIDWDTYRRYWLSEPRQYFDYGNYRPPSWYRSPRRYYFSYDVL